MAAPRSSRRRRVPRHGIVAVVATALLVALAAACSSGSSDDASSTVPGTTPGSVTPEPPVVVASTQLAGALVRSVAGDRVDLRVLTEPGADPTTATLADPATLGEADLVVVIDPATYERGLAEPIRASGIDPSAVLALAPQLNPIPLGGSELDPGSTDAGGATDPHVWLDPDRWTQAARLVGERISDLDGVDPAAIGAYVAAFDESLGRTDETLQATFAVVPEHRRVLVGDLPALGYLADRYGFDLVTAAEPITVVATATERGVPAVFTAPARVGPLTAAATATPPPVPVVALDLDATAVDAEGLDLAGATAAYVELIVGTSDSIASAVSA